MNAQPYFMPAVLAAAAAGTYVLTDIVLGIYMQTGSLLLTLVVMGAAAYGFMLLLVHVLLPLPMWFYLVSDRRTPVTLAEARELAPLFIANRRGEWSEVPELEDVPREERVAYLRDLLRRRREEGVMFGSPTPPSSARRNAPILLEVRDPAGMTGRAAWRERGWADLWDLLEQDATGLRELAGTLDAYPQKAFLGSGWIVLSNCFPSRGEADAALSAVREEIGRRLDDHGKGTSG